MESLFSEQEQCIQKRNAPLAYRMRPKTLDEYVGQQQAIGKDSWLYKAITKDALSSVILYGPSGTGKTTLARIIAQTTRANFLEVSAVGGTVKDLRDALAEAKQTLLQKERRTILFIDEIHRFSRSQQDVLLHAVEDRTVVLIGATTENPYFEVNQALLSRSRVVELAPLCDQDIKIILMRAIHDKNGLDDAFVLDEEALSYLVCSSAGDARVALTTLELAAQIATPDVLQTQKPWHIGLHDVELVAPKTQAIYDKSGDMHYDVISAFIKSMRGSDADAAVYWLAKMLDAGEDPKFIARRIYILAAEDIGNADPQALLVAQAAFKACEVIGMPECKIVLAQAAIYMALAPKSNACVQAIMTAEYAVKHQKAQNVPEHLRDRHRPGSKAYKPYKYPHDYPGNWVEQQYLPYDFSVGDFYRPSENGWEEYRSQAIMRERGQKDQQHSIHKSCKSSINHVYSDIEQRIHKTNG